MIIYVVPNTSKINSFKIAAEAIAVLNSNGISSILLKTHSFSFEGVKHIVAETEKQALELCDMVLTVGGDGTMLHMAHKLLSIIPTKPLIGVNTGHLGFLTTIESYELSKLANLSTGEYILEERGIIMASNSINFNNNCYALNDIVLFKSGFENTAVFDVFCDDVQVSSFRGDGAIFSTPTGSTAYSMSAGGPIVDACLDAIIFTQICAHVVHMPPMVFSGNRLIKVVPDEEHGKIDVIFDGVHSENINGCNNIYIKKSDLALQLVQLEETGQLKSIDKKLKGR